MGHASIAAIESCDSDDVHFADMLVEHMLLSEPQLTALTTYVPS